VSLAVASEGKGVAPEILPTQILLWEDGQMVTSYRVAERTLPETNSVVFILPLARGGAQAAAKAAALECLPWKRPSDLWACSYYEVGPGEMAMMEENPPRFHSNPGAIAAEFGKTPERGSPDVWHAIWYAVDAASIIGKRQLIVFGDGITASGAGSELIAAVAAARAGVQVITSGPDRRLEEFCRKVNGVLWDRSLVVDAYLNLLARYEVVYQPPAPGGKTLRIRLHAPGSRGELTIPVPQE
jgi:hypothetical protein